MRGIFMKTAMLMNKNGLTIVALKDFTNKVITKTLECTENEIEKFLVRIQNKMYRLYTTKDSINSDRLVIAYDYTHNTTVSVGALILPTKLEEPLTTNDLELVSSAIRYNLSTHRNILYYESEM